MFNLYHTKKWVMIAALVLMNSQASCMQRLIGMTDYVVSAAHTFCPFCWYDSERHLHEFAQAIERDNDNHVKFLIDRRNFSPHELLQDFKLPLVYAAQHASVNVMRVLLERGADPDSKLAAPEYPSALIALCAQKGLDDEKVKNGVELLLQFNAKPALTSAMLTNSEIEALCDKNKKSKDPFALYGCYPVGSMPSEPVLSRQERMAYDFAVLHNYKEAAALLRKVSVHE